MDVPERVISDEDGLCPRRNWEGQHSLEGAQVEDDQFLSPPSLSTHVPDTCHVPSPGLCVGTGGLKSWLRQSPDLQQLPVSVV